MANNNPNFFAIDDALTPLDGRNRYKLIPVSSRFSDFLLNKYRIYVEIEYFKKLSDVKLNRKLSNKEISYLTNIYKSFSRKDYLEIRKIEKNVNHEMKAVEEYLIRKIKKTSLFDVAQMVHFGLTSDDINNCAYGLMVKNLLSQVIIPEIEKIISSLKENSIKYKSLPMLGRTHGQPAAPTTMGKEFLIYFSRLQKETTVLKSINLEAKVTGNTGNFNVHEFLYPKINWLDFSKKFILNLGLEPDLVTTQIEPYDSYIKIFHSLIRINNILIGLCIDAWIYIGLNYFKQKLIVREVGSTALPHKINPIYFEGAEGGFGIANALFEFYCRKLSYSRLQRDLSDSTVRRSFGMAFGYSFLSYQSVNEALKRIEPNPLVIEKDLLDHWEVVSEGLQNFLRLKGNSQAYDKTKAFFRGKSINKNDVMNFIKSLNLDEDDFSLLKDLSPTNYFGLADVIVDKTL